MSAPNVQHVIEALILASESPLSSDGIIEAAKQACIDKQIHLDQLAESEAGDGETPEPQELPPIFKELEVLTTEQVIDAITSLNAEYESMGRAMIIRERPRGWQVMTRPEYAEFVQGLFPDQRPSRLSGPALETMAIIAYRQPITKAEIEAVRGVSVDGMVQKLLDLEFVKIAGRAELPGRPLLYITTEKFLEHFNVKSVDELPNAAELRRAPLPTAEEVHKEKAVEEEPTTESESTEQNDEQETVDDTQKSPQTKDTAEPNEDEEAAKSED